MITIRNTNLFNELKANPKWDTLFNFQEPELKDSEIPTLTGGLDHIDVKAKGIYFHDIGCNNRDHSFVIRPEL